MAPQAIPAPYRSLQAAREAKREQPAQLQAWVRHRKAQPTGAGKVEKIPLGDRETQLQLRPGFKAGKLSGHERAMLALVTVSRVLVTLLK